MRRPPKMCDPSAVYWPLHMLVCCRYWLWLVWASRPASARPWIPAQVLLWRYCDRRWGLGAASWRRRPCRCSPKHPHHLPGSVVASMVHRYAQIRAHIFADCDCVCRWQHTAARNSCSNDWGHGSRCGHSVFPTCPTRAVSGYARFRYDGSCSSSSRWPARCLQVRDDQR